MKTAIRTRVTATVLAGLATAGLAAPTIGYGDESTLRRDGSEAVPFVANPEQSGELQGVPALRRDGSKAVAFDPMLGPATSAPADDFDWGDAGVGAALGGAAALVGIGAAAAVRGRRRAAWKAPRFDGQTASD